MGYYTSDNIRCALCGHKFNTYCSIEKSWHDYDYCDTKYYYPDEETIKINGNYICAKCSNDLPSAIKNKLLKDCKFKLSLVENKKAKLEKYYIADMEKFNKAEENILNMENKISSINNLYDMSDDDIDNLENLEIWSHEYISYLKNKEEERQIQSDRTNGILSINEWCYKYELKIKKIQDGYTMESRINANTFASILEHSVVEHSLVLGDYVKMIDSLHTK